DTHVKLPLSHTTSASKRMMFHGRQRVKSRAAKSAAVTPSRAVRREANARNNEASFSIRHRMKDAGTHLTRQQSQGALGNACRHQQAPTLCVQPTLHLDEFIKYPLCEWTCLQIQRASRTRRQTRLAKRKRTISLVLLTRWLVAAAIHRSREREGRHIEGSKGRQHTAPHHAHECGPAFAGDSMQLKSRLGTA
ncbi:unnamed protein product, partial [Vitrella brassicaformis CCMP3155]